MQTEVEPPTHTLKRTALYAQHKALGARFGSFAGWELPMYYSSILQEHEAVRHHAGLFDVSHLAHLEVSGPDALSQLQLLVTQDLEAVEPGRAGYTPMLTPRGSILDEMIVYRLEPERFRLVANAANAEKVLSWLRSRVHPPAQIRDLRDSVGTLALQGPEAADVLREAAPGVGEGLARYGIVSGLVAGAPAHVARTGYTGEDGFELFVPTGNLEAVWKSLLEAGREKGIRPAGLGARDTLRLEAGLPLGGAGLDEKSTPLEAGLEWTVAWRKGPFVGRDALERQRRQGVARCLAGFELRDPGVPRPGYPIYRGEERVGVVTSGCMVPAASASEAEPGAASPLRAIGLGYVPPTAARPGTEILIGIHQRRARAGVVELPFYRRKK